MKSLEGDVVGTDSGEEGGAVAAKDGAPEGKEESTVV